MTSTVELCSHRVEANAAWVLCGRHAAEGRGGAVALREEERSWTYADVWAHIGGFGRLLRRRGVRAEDRVVVILPDSLEAVTAALGSMAAGAVAVLLGARLTQGEYLQMVDDARPALVVVGSAHAWLAELDLPHGPDVLVHDDAALFTGWDDEHGPPDVAPVSPDEPAAIQFTSGSTGTPKGVVHLHAGLARCHEGIGSRIGLTPEDRCFSTAKLSYGFGFGNSVLFPFSAGASAVLHRGLVDARTAASVTRRLAPTVFFAVPTLYASILDNAPDLRDAFASVRLCVSAGEHLNEALTTEWMDRTGVEIVDGLGCTESLHIFISNQPGALTPGRTGTPVPGVEVSLVDDEGLPVPPGQLGHVRVKSPWNAARYWNRQDVTRRTMEGEWCRTGDIMSQHPDGSFVYFGRSDDVMKIRGLKVAPSEVEAVLLSHPEVAEAAAVQATDERGVATIAAYVRPRESEAHLTEPALRAHARERLASHKVPSTITVVPELPHTSTGKLARNVLRREANAAPVPTPVSS
jgi:benzoate-CoA ligase family protein